MPLAFQHLSRSKVDTHSQLPINRLITFHLGIESPLVQGSHPGDSQFTMFGRLKDHHCHLRIFGNQHAGFHPVVKFFAVQGRWHGRPGSSFGYRSKLLVLVERQTMNMDLGQLQHIFMMVVRMRGLVTGHRMNGNRRTAQNAPDEQRHKTIQSHHRKSLVHSSLTGILYHQMPNKVIQQGRRKPGD